MKTVFTGLTVTMLLMMSLDGEAAVKPVETPFVYAKDLISKCSDFCHVQLAKSPAPGQKATIYAREIITSLDAAGYKVTQQRLPRSFRIVRVSKSVNAAQMTEAARGAIMDVLPEGVVLEQMGKVHGGEVPTGEWEARAIYEESTGAQRTRSIAVVFLADGVPFRKAFVLCRMSYVVNVPVAAMDIRRDEVIRSGAIVLKKMKMDTPLRNVVLDADKIIGKKSRGVIRQGSPFELRDLEEIPVVHRGDMVTLINQVNGIRVTVRGIARQDAVRGNRIAVEIPTVGKVLFVRIVSAGLGVVQQ
ncbi:MAG: flagellar basal body P-ring formation protein FlgA [Deltaproteobacteria bacterium]|nr:flagellar basal body P-ring formation protein FlgA [Deltaproteobacteria bacterium]